MLKHPDIDVQALVEMLEGQRDNAMVQAVALFRENTELKQKLTALIFELLSTFVLSFQYCSMSGFQLIYNKMIIKICDLQR